MGDRSIEPSGSFNYEDAKNQLKAMIKFGTYKKSGMWNVTVTGGKDCFEGLIYSTKEQFTPTIFNKQTKLSDKLDKIPDMKTKLADLSGSVL